MARTLCHLLGLSVALSACAGQPHPAQPPNEAQTVIRVEAEAGHLRGVEVKSDGSGFSGRGYVTGFDQEGDALELDVDAARGLYELRVVYRSPHGPKGFAVRVNEESGSGTFQPAAGAFAAHRAGTFSLRDGKNRIVLEKGWGYYDIDHVVLVPARVAPVPKPAKEPVNSRASAEARALLHYLVSIYGAQTLSGQQSFEDIEYVRLVTGREPAVGSFDMMEYSPSRRERGADVKNLTARIAGWAEQRPAIVSLCWHWNAPAGLLDEAGGKEWWRGFYTEATTFDVAVALGDASSQEHRLLLRDLDAIALELRRLQDANVPVLWRPLHEAQGGWFWWGAKGARPFVELWRLMYDRFVNHHGLNHLLWVYSPPEGGITAADWYPGDAFVDVVGVDLYTRPGDSMSGAWQALRSAYSGHKLLALAESGTLPDPEQARRHGVHWAWFSLWNGKFVRDVPESALKAAYAHDRVITRDELPPELARRPGAISMNLR